MSTCDGVTVIRVRGEIDLANARTLDEALNRAAQAALPVVVDLGETSYIDSTGLHLLVKRNVAPGPRLAVVFTSDLMRRIFTVLSLQELIPVYPSVPAAVAALSQSDTQRDRAVDLPTA
jgi:anti-anti-sigma factor